MMQPHKYYEIKKGQIERIGREIGTYQIHVGNQLPF